MCWQNRDRDQPTHPHMLGHADCAQVFRQAITHPLTPHPHGPTGPDVKFEVVYGVSDSNWCASLPWLPPLPLLLLLVLLRLLLLLLFCCCCFILLPLLVRHC